MRVVTVVLVGSVVLLAASLAGGFAVRSDVGCTVCHSMRPYAMALAEASHATLGCAECHASVGTTGLLADGFRFASWVTGSEPHLAYVDPDVCLGCHADVREGIVEAAGIAVRHADFLGEPCSSCHGGVGHRVENRWYRVLEMDDCMGCHRSSGQDPDQCAICHVPDATREDRREGPTAWRATHGPGWQSTHGMGDLDTCVSCHAPGFCTDCHGVRVPHPTDWLASHGPDTNLSGQTACATCHDPEWCTGCHGLEMPHASEFIKVHGPIARDSGEDVCGRCHDLRSCEVCHYESSHPNFPGIGMTHEATQ